MLITFLDQVCTICQDDIGEDFNDDNPVVYSSCCITLYHKKCLTRAKIYSTTCPTCCRDYSIIDDEPELNYIINRKHDYEFICDFYKKIYRHNPIQLQILDSDMRARRTDYYSLYKGYFPIETFSAIEQIGEQIVKLTWREHTYGIFDSLDWQNIVALDAQYFLPKIKQFGTDPIEFLIYSDKYQCLRTTLMYFINFIAKRLNVELQIAYQNNKVQILIAGFMKPLLVTLSYEKEIAVALQKCNRPIVFYQNGQVYASVNYITLLEYDKPSKDTYKYHIMKYDMKINIRTISVTQFFEQIMPPYILCVTVTDHLGEAIIKRILAEIKIIDIYYHTIQQNKSIKIVLSHASHAVEYQGSIFNKNDIRAFITNNIKPISI